MAGNDDNFNYGLTPTMTATRMASAYLTIREDFTHSGTPGFVLLTTN